MEKENLAVNDYNPLPTSILNQMRTLALRDMYAQEIFDLKRRILQKKFPLQHVVIVLAKVCDENKEFLCSGDTEGLLKESLKNESTLILPMTRKSTFEFLKTFDVTAMEKMREYPDELLEIIITDKVASVFPA